MSDTMHSGYLEFVELDDYLAHLQQVTLFHPVTTHCEITSVSSQPNQHGITGIMYYAALTFRDADHIATCAVALLNTTNFHLQTDKEAVHTKLHANFDKVVANLTARGIEVTRGKWTLTAPNYLGV